jgi:hypothetical protein
MAKNKSDAWQQAARDILDRLDIRAAYAELGVEITGQEPNGAGWLECRAYGRVDSSPSAGINLGEHPARGRYKEFVGDGLNLSLFEFAAHAGRFPTWQEARNHFAGVAGVKLPGTKPPRHPTDSLEFRDYNSALVLSWTLKKPGISETAVTLCGGRIATEGKKHTVVTLPVFGEHGLNDDPCGWVSWNITGKPLEIWQGKGIPPKHTKMKTASGSRAGWMGRHGFEVLPAADFVWITEGPSDMLGLVTVIADQAPEQLGSHAVLCNSAGAMERADFDSVSLFAGRRVVVIPDCDQPGQVGCRRRAEAIAEVAASVRFVRLPFEIAENHGKDLRDYLNGGATFADLLKLAEVAEVIRAPERPPSMSDDPSASAGEQREQQKTDGAKTFYEEQMLEQIGIDVLGEMDGGRIKIFSEFHRKCDVISDIGKLGYHRLVQIAGPSVKAKVHQGTEQIPDMYAFTEVKESIALMAGYRRIEDIEAGAGCWQGIDEDGEPSGAIILVGAGEAAVRNGKPGLKRVTKPRYGGRLLDISTSTAWYDFAELNDLVLSCDAATSEQTVAELEGMFARWRWTHDGQAPKVLAGLVLATWVQSLWVWRPQVSIIGKSNSGKSTLFKMLEGLFGSLAITSSGSTAAGIRQAIAKSAAVMLLDEFESGRHRVEILEMLRASGRGDRVLRGTASHKGQEFTLRHIAWVAGIESGLRREPDRNRFIRQELVRPAPNEMGRLNLPSEAEMRHLGQRSLAVALRIAMQAKEAASSLRVLKFEGIDTRLIEGYAVPAACYAAAMGESNVGPASDVLGKMLQTVEVTEVMDDAMQLLGDILETEVASERGSKSTVAQILQRRKLDPAKLDDCERAGVGIVEHGSGEAFFVAHRSASRYLLKNTDWEHQNIDEILKRVDGAEKVKKRIAGKQPWGIVIPLKVLRKLGLEQDGTLPEQF